jgi:hypothetical protein
MQQPIDPNKPLSATLAAEQWNAVLFVLRRHPMPFETSAPIIVALERQLQQQAQQQAQQIFSTEDVDGSI